MPVKIARTTTNRIDIKHVTSKEVGEKLEMRKKKKLSIQKVVRRVINRQH